MMMSHTGGSGDVVDAVQLAGRLWHAFLRAAVFSCGLGLMIYVVVHAFMYVPKLIRTLVEASQLPRLIRSAKRKANLDDSDGLGPDGRDAKERTQTLKNDDVQELLTARVSICKPKDSWTRRADAQSKDIRAVMCVLPALGAKERIFTHATALAIQSVRYLHGTTKRNTVQEQGDLLVVGWDHPHVGSRRTDVSEHVDFHSNRKDAFWNAILQSAKDVSHVLDWVAATYPETALKRDGGEGKRVPVICIGFSVGGDAFVTAATLDERVTHVLAVSATPNWLRPGGKPSVNKGLDVPFTEGDRLYASTCPYVHGERLRPHQPHIYFLSGADDDHTPVQCAETWIAQLQSGVYEECSSRLRVIRVPGANHMLLRHPTGVEELYTQFSALLSDALMWCSSSSSLSASANKKTD